MQKTTSTSDTRFLVLCTMNLILYRWSMLFSASVPAPASAPLFLFLLLGLGLHTLIHSKCKAKRFFMFSL